LPLKKTQENKCRPFRLRERPAHITAKERRESAYLLVPLPEPLEPLPIDPEPEVEGLVDELPPVLPEP
jgi:hypothetical protein